MFKRVLLKMSGEALKGTDKIGINPDTILEISLAVKKIVEAGISVGIVSGGGNIFRGETGEKLGMNREKGDYMGMLATVFNSLAIAEGLSKQGLKVKVLSCLSNQLCEDYDPELANDYLEQGYVCIYAGGTGKPYFTTDTAAALRAKETSCDAMLMAKNGVDGVYDSDPRVNPDAKFIKHLSAKEVLDKGLKVMDLDAAKVLYEANIKTIVFNMNETENIYKVASGVDIGTIIE